MRSVDINYVIEWCEPEGETDVYITYNCMNVAKEILRLRQHNIIPRSIIREGSNITDIHVAFTNYLIPIFIR